MCLTTYPPYDVRSVPTFPRTAVPCGERTWSLRAPGSFLRKCPRFCFGYFLSPCLHACSLANCVSSVPGCGRVHLISDAGLSLTCTSGFKFGTRESRGGRWTVSPPALPLVLGLRPPQLGVVSSPWVTLPASCWPLAVWCEDVHLWAAPCLRQPRLSSRRSSVQTVAF